MLSALLSLFHKLRSHLQARLLLSMSMSRDDFLRITSAEEAHAGDNNDDAMRDEYVKRTFRKRLGMARLPSTLCIHVNRYAAVA